MIVKGAGNYTETCFSDVPAQAGSGPDSGLEVVVVVTLAGMAPLDPVVVHPPPPTVGTFVDLHFSPQLLCRNVHRVPVGETIRVWTQGTDVGNPVLFLSDSYLRRVVDQDDNNGPGGYPEAEVSYTVPQSAGYDFTDLEICILPEDNWSFGRTTMCYEYADVSECTTDDFGGHYLEMGKHAQERIHLAWLPGGPGAAYAILLQRIPSLNPLEPKVDFVVRGDAAAGNASWPGRVALEAPPFDWPLRLLFVAPTTEAASEEVNRVRVLSNDVAMASTADIPDRDPDKDGVGYLLERFIGTCDSPSQVVEVAPSPPGGYHCGRVKNRADTDGDGLSDYWEIFGVPASEVQGHDPDEAFGVPLTWFGSDPRHKDLFLELDTYRLWTPDLCASGDPTDPECFTEKRYFFDMVAAAAAIFVEQGTAGDLNNPDGVDGIKLHADLGPEEAIHCNPGEALCGDWGGSGPDIGDDATDPQNVVRPGHLEARRVGLTKRRWGIFRYGWCGDGGSQRGQGFDDVFRGRSCEDTDIIPHELGHTLGLSHGGVDGVNCKPHYLSLMNYGYHNHLRFSKGERLYLPGTQELYFLNPLRICEGLGVGSSAEIFPLTAEGYQHDLQNAYDTLVLPAVTELLASVDWNQDGQIEPGSSALDCLTSGAGAISAPLLTDCDENATIHRDELLFPANEHGPGTPKLLRKPSGEVALFHQDAQGRLVERNHPDDFNGCRDQGGYCHHWWPPRVVFETAPVVQRDHARFDAVRLGFGVLFVFATAGNRVVMQRAVEVYSQNLPGTEWSLEPPEEIPGASIKPGFRPIIQLLNGVRHVFFWGSDDLLWEATRSGAQTDWVVQHVQVNDDNGHLSLLRTIPLATDYPIDPAVAIGRPPSDPVGTDRLYLVVKTSLGAAPPALESWDNVLYLLEATAMHSWRTPGFTPIRVHHYSGALNQEGTPIVPAPRHNVALAYVPNDHSIPAYPGQVDLTKGGRLYLASTRILTPDVVRFAFSSPTDFFSWTGRAPSELLTLRLPSWDDLPEIERRDGISILSEPGYDANPRVVAKVSPALYQTALSISPFADGIRDWRLYDYSDWWVMRDGLCRKLVRHRCPSFDCVVDSSLIEDVCGPQGPYPAGVPEPTWFLGGGGGDDVDDY